MMSLQWFRQRALLAATALCLIAAGAAAQGNVAAPRPVSPRGELTSDERSTIDLFERSRDSVVFITTRAQVRDFWTRNVYSVPRGTGSGFIWDEAGHVITNFHVIEDASEAIVKLADGREFKASLVGASRAHDLAVLRIGIAARRPAPVPIGTSHDLRVGQKVLAIGNPFGLDWTLTTGIVSALDRSLSGDDGYTINHLIQTDAAINPGNSGGPLLDSAGRLIGVNTAIYSPSGSSAGIGFAVPVDTVNRVVPQLIRSGKYIRPSLGVELDEDLNRRLSRLLDVAGVVVLRVGAGTPAANAGLKGLTILRNGEVTAGDIITAVEGKPVDSVGKLLARLDDFRVGDTVRISVLRNGKTIELRLALQAGI
ncbi:S1C family serine protease [Propionivibrio dicarboxylicus]|uniref:DegP2 peptidase. Serine peptidase. MEROPS family S01B n=1 Tax=Propionivibrio dicarboxylicus TaxID=83767 RepID=A0A1G8G525_9RHOO|nr:trypsin-like peptidase domain-containing protein [Propionivibrio dicarboxylicus]SDH89469.1 DegP2 peptidase. Serine peptidase. MEROPS family S01B [Propionivibrio dicarboxylicus]